MTKSSMPGVPVRVGPSLSELRPGHWHRPLLILAAAMGVLAILQIAGVFLDSREVTNAQVWLKPLKFSLSIGVYSLTLAWLIGRLPSGALAKVASVAGTIAAVGLAIEIVIIDWFALVGESSHFNLSTPFHATSWHVMAASISVVWVMTLVVSALLFRAPLGDAARSLAIRAGAVLSLAGMALAFLMTGATADQPGESPSFVGAHTVGLADGGPGLPLLGWSTVAGDLRIPHFVGMHALQVLPLFVLLLEVLARKVPALWDDRRRFRLVVLAVATFAATLVLLTYQALMGESIVAPSGIILTGGIIVATAALAGAVVIVSVPTSARGEPPKVDGIRRPGGSIK